MPGEFSARTAEKRYATKVPVVKIGDTIKDVGELLVKKATTFETVDYVYVVDSKNVLRGVMSIREILSMRNRNVKVESVMGKKLVVAHPSTHQERVVYLALSHNLKSVPIVDKGGRLLGVIPYDVVLRIFNEEVHEDVLKFGGIFHKVGSEYATIDSSATSMIKHRLPWLVIGVVGGAITAGIVSGFEDILGRLLTLAAFAPVLPYLSDAVGTQSETLVVRSMALEPKLRVKAYFTRELIVALVLALACGVMLSFTALVGWWDTPMLGAIVGISMFLSILAAVLISTSLPFAFKRLDWDPAFAAGPFATMLSDMTTVVIYFLVASVLLAQNGLL